MLTRASLLVLLSLVASPVVVAQEQAKQQPRTDGGLEYGTVKFKDGREMSGLVDESEVLVRISMGIGTVQVTRGEVESIHYLSAEEKIAVLEKYIKKLEAESVKKDARIRELETRLGIQRQETFEKNKKALEDLVRSKAEAAQIAEAAAQLRAVTESIELGDVEKIEKQKKIVKNAELRVAQLETELLDRVSRGIFDNSDFNRTLTSARNYLETARGVLIRISRSAEDRAK